MCTETSVMSALLFFLTVRRPPSSTLFPTRRSSDLKELERQHALAEARAKARARQLAAMKVRARDRLAGQQTELQRQDRKSTRLNSSHVEISYAVFCLKKKSCLCSYAVAPRSR